MNNHGGARAGAGRKPKWDFYTRLAIGQACEIKWRGASEQAKRSNLSALAYGDEFRAIQDKLQHIPEARRKAWASENLEDQLGDFESWLHARSETHFDEDTGVYQHEPQRIFRISERPHRGTRKRIIKEVAMEIGLPESTVDNLLQEYRRLERKLASGPISTS